MNIGCWRLVPLLLGACSHSHREAPPELRLELVRPSADMGGARIAQITADRPVSVRLELREGHRLRVVCGDRPATAHRIPVLGIPAGSGIEVSAIGTDAEGRAIGAGPLWVEADPLPERFPSIAVLALEPERMEPGYTLLATRVPEEDVDVVLALDSEARPVWWLHPEVPFGGDVLQTAAGTLLGLSRGDIAEVSMLGEELRRLDAGGEDLHHEVFPLDDGTFLSPRTAPLIEPDYPASPLLPDGPTARALIEDHELLRIGATGEILSSWLLSERVDTTRVSRESFQRTAEGRLDWAHVNGLIGDPADGGVVASLRHQDAIVKLDSRGDLQWILGDPGGWTPPWSDRLLRPIGEWAWPYHAHAPALTDDGLLVVFDNHNHGATAYDPDPPAAPDRSRVAAFRIDEDQGTVALAFALDATATGPLYCGVNGDADVLPLTGNVLADFGMVRSEGGVLNADLGWGERAVRLVEWALDRPEAPVMDLRLYSDLSEEPKGWQAFRAERIPDLYPPGAGAGAPRRGGRGPRRSRGRRPAPLARISGRPYSPPYPAPAASNPTMSSTPPSSCSGPTGTRRSPSTRSDRAVDRPGHRRGPARGNRCGQQRLRADRLPWSDQGAA